MSSLITAMPSFSIYLTWERRSRSSNIQYDILYSTNFDGEYTLVDSVTWPQNEYIHTTGNPSYYYKIREIDITDPLNPVTLETSQPIVGDEALVLASLMYQLNDLLSVPVHDEEVIFTRNRTSATVAFDKWNFHPTPEIRITSSSNNNTTDPFIILSEYDATYATLNATIQPFTVDFSTYDGIQTTQPHQLANGQQIKFVGVNLPTEITAGDTYKVIYTGANTRRFTIETMSNSVINFTHDGAGQVYLATDTLNYPTGLKYKIDYQGKIFFIDENDDPVSIQPYDIVYASYNVKMWTEHEINDAAYMALQAINLQPGTNKVGSLAAGPSYYDPCVVTGACYFLIRGLLLRLTQRELRLLVDDPDKFDMIGQLKELAKMYKEDFDGFLKTVGKARFPGTLSIVTPEYQMPGGRSRFFRYIWRSGGG